MGIVVTSIALEGTEWFQQVDVVGMYCRVFDHVWPRIALANASSVWLFSKEISAMFHLYGCYVGTVLQVRQILFMVLAPRLVVHNGIKRRKLPNEMA